MIENPGGPIGNRWVFHFTHVGNIASIVGADRLVSDRSARLGLLSTEVGDPDIKEGRRNRLVPLAGGGRVGDYVPFYFAPLSPMMYRIACDHRDGKDRAYRGGDHPLIYLGTTVEALIGAGCQWVATDGNARTATTSFTADLDQADTMVDWDLMHAERWHNTFDDPDRQRRRMAEFLVRDQVPLAAIRWFAAYSDGYADRIRAALGRRDLRNRIHVRPDLYYGYEPRR